jgi:PTH1 family peptidyl-tRNA hydrolase
MLDDLALPCGRLRLRASGSSGGHNGLNDIERAIGTREYARMRLGIDAAPEFVPSKDYVLGRFTQEQRKLLEPALARAVDAARAWIQEGTQSAMNRFNAEEKQA